MSVESIDLILTGLKKLNKVEDANNFGKNLLAIEGVTDFKIFKESKSLEAVSSFKFKERQKVSMPEFVKEVEYYLFCNRDYENFSVSNIISTLKGALNVCKD